MAAICSIQRIKRSYCHMKNIVMFSPLLSRYSCPDEVRYKHYCQYYDSKEQKFYVSSYVLPNLNLSQKAEFKYINTSTKFNDMWYTSWETKNISTTMQRSSLKYNTLNLSNSRMSSRIISYHHHHHHLSPDPFLNQKVRLLNAHFPRTLHPFRVFLVVYPKDKKINMVPTILF